MFLMQTFNELLHFDFCLAGGNACTYRSMSRETASLLGHLDSQINRVGKILHPDTPLPHGTFCAVTELKLWETLLESREKESLLSNIRSFLYSKAPLLTLENMQEIRQDIVQIIYSFLKHNEILAHKLFSDEKSDLLYQNSVRSLDNMMNYCRLLIERAMDYVNFSSNTQSTVEIIQSYLDLHYAENIQRNDLSNIVYLSSDYLSRIFKKETGYSLMQYVTRKRISVACDLLKSSNLPIHAVALQVGFSSFSYFSKVFRETTGLSPQAYRHQFSSKEH